MSSATSLNLSPADISRLRAAIPTMPDSEKRRVAALLKEYQSEKVKIDGKNNFISFIKHVYPGYIVGPHHYKLAKIFEDIAAGRNKRVIVNIAPRHGKLLADDTPVLTTRGWKQHGNLQVGDEVFHPSGHPVQVVAVSASAAADMRVEFFDGSVFYCHGAHEWTMFNMVRRQWETFETQRFLKPNPRNPAALKQVLSDGRALHHLPLVAPLQFPEVDLLVHPYVLGAWLGDGSAGKPCVTHSKDDQPYVDRIAHLGYPVSSVCTHATTGVITTYFSGPKPNNAGRLTRELQTLGIYRNKKIPEQYLRGSVRQRLDLLAGLMDTDGSVDKNSRCVFTSCNRALVEGVIELVRSFGWRSCEMEYQPRLSSSGIQGKKVYWTVSFQPTFIIPTALQRKQILRFQEQRRIGLKSVTLDPQGKIGRCIQVASEDGLYLVGRALVPTHNSELISYLAPAWYLGNHPQKKVIMASHTADLAVDFGRRVRNLVDSDSYHDIFPTISLQADSKSASRWGTNFGGQYFAIGVGGALAGRGADLFIIDDPHALPLDTEVPTPEGFRTIAQLRVGDEVYGPDGLPTRITAKSDVRKDRELYRLTTDDGEQVLCDGGHLWSYHSATALKNAHLIKTATARELAGWGKDNRPCLPRHAAVQYVHADLPIDPYILGVWLGDGTSTVGRMTAHPDDQPFMRKQFKDAGYETTDLVDPYNFGVKGLWTELKKWDLLDNKHIPVDYMLASVKQRMALVQGLMDTDGNVTVAGECSFNNCNESLVRQFRELLHSLGIKAKIRVYYDSRPNHNPVFRVNFKLADCCRMPRKRERTYTPTDKRRRSFEVEATGLRGDVQCITVDRPDGLFLVGRGYVVTHNSEQEAKQGRPDVFLPAWEWFQSGPVQRMMPGGSIIIVMCMTGDTPVLMADGTELPLRDVQPGWMIASYENGRIVTKRVMNHQSSGIDQVFTLSTLSGRMLRANERHPFLVEQNGGQAWVRLRDLKPGMSLVALKGAADPHGRRLDPACAIPAERERLTIASTLTRLTSLWGTTVSYGVRHAPTKGAPSLPKPKGFVGLTTTRFDGRLACGHLHTPPYNAEISGSSPATASLVSSTMQWLRSAIIAATSAVNHQLLRMSGHTGTANSASITAMTLGRSEACSAIIATSQSDTVIPPHSLNPPPAISDFTLDPIVSITPSGREEVFDIQVADTENFIANGVVSHNTRWSKLDLTGMAIDHMMKNDDSAEWEVVEFPALLNDKPLWPEFWTLEDLLSKKADMDPRYWQAQYMQQPTSEEGALIKREWWKVWEKESPPVCEYIIMSLDAAQEANNRADYNALQVWGVFFNEEVKNYQIILLNSIKERLEYPELKAMVLEEYKDWKPDSFIVEKKSSGSVLFQEMRRTGVPVSEFTPGKGQDKISRVNAVADLFSSGIVWIPDRRWAWEVVEECNDFPAGRNDDMVDACTLALLRFRQGGFIRLPSDEPEPIQLFKSRRNGSRRYY